MSDNVSCPNCGNVLEKRPKRKKKCPHCGEYMYVRRGNVYTEQGAAEYDWKQRLEAMFEYSPEQYDAVKQGFIEKSGREPNTRDVVWRILNNLVLNGKAADAYLEMAHFVEDEGKDPSKFYDLHKEFTAKEIRSILLEMRRKGRRFVKYHNCNDNLVCSSCRSWEDKKIPIEQALSEMRIPNLCDSELKFCRCWVMPWIDYSEDDEETFSDFRWNTEGGKEVVEEKRSWLDRLLGR